LRQANTNSTVPAAGDKRIAQRLDHRPREVSHPALNTVSDLHGAGEGHRLPLDGGHGNQSAIVFAESDAVDARKKLLKVGLDDGRVLRLSEDLKQVVVAEEVEARELAPALQR
jgi:aryl carrier-like protein